MYAFKDLFAHSQSYARIYRFVYKSHYMFRDYFFYKSDYAHTDSKYTFADSCTHSQISERM